MLLGKSVGGVENGWQGAGWWTSWSLGQPHGSWSSMQGARSWGAGMAVLVSHSRAGNTGGTAVAPQGQECMPLEKCQKGKEKPVLPGASLTPAWSSPAKSVSGY